MNTFQQRQHDRRTRLEARAGKARSASQIAYAAAKQMASAIPSGQPVLAGHYWGAFDSRAFFQLDAFKPDKTLPCGPK
ncbi:hypothetical protein WL99_19330 [Burkholderia cepacia]|uniref:DUF3560 domain-containing protein n=1 Tax=Burkholderia cepacia TaxID=292 RepID=UPI00075707D8|nr:DUF3560 domain-containing protein [Burkholderia cepacia]KWH27866.1 hypothetical protein WL99_19330 [Burkholderia cepacia]